MTYRLLICGSRRASIEMRELAEAAVFRAIHKDWRIVVGDASGVDLAVASYCYRQGVEFDCYGITDKPRIWGWVSQISIDSGLMNYRRIHGNYLARDRAMVDAADRVFAIWNGVSRGTKYTYDYAVKQGKAADIRTYGATS